MNRKAIRSLFDEKAQVVYNSGLLDGTYELSKLDYSPNENLQLVYRSAYKVGQRLKQIRERESKRGGLDD